ncbi:MAG TPA: serine hydrolase domain-containing protein, partial [Gammaproteobacteria bacterium]|nr:serine hydrolase domain-containing protein [Gammaproteobacteria bacterium]
MRGTIISRILICSTLLWASLQAFGQVANPEGLGLSADRLTRIEALMQRHIDASRFTGAVTLVARDNQIAWLQAQGVMDLESGRPMQTDGVFRIMSMTKPVVAFAILMMVEEGKVRLTDPASRFIPELEGLPVMAASTPAPVPASRDITVRDLLTHSSGLMSGAASSSVAVEFAPGATLADLLPLLGDSVLEFDPG